MATPPAPATGAASAATARKKLPRFKKKTAEQKAAEAAEASQEQQRQQPHPFPSASSRVRQPKSAPSSEHSSRRSTQPIPPLPTPSTSPPSAEPTPSAPLQPAPAPPQRPPQDFSAAARWGELVVLAYGTKYIPPNAHGRRMAGYVHDDARWGIFDYALHPQPNDRSSAHMACIPVPPNRKTVTHTMPYRAPTKEDLEEGLHQHKDLEDIYNDGVPLPSDCICRWDLHEQMMPRVNGLREEFATATRLLASALLTGSLSGICLEVGQDLVVPTAAAIDMRKAWGLLRYGRIRSFADFAVCWEAYRRFSSEVEGFVLLCTGLLKDVDDEDAKAWLKARRRFKRPGVLPAADAQTVPMRGVILAGEDIEKFHDFYRALGVPTYLEMPFEAAGVPEEKLEEPGTIRSEANVNFKLSFVKQKDLPLRWYAPEDVAWEEVQAYARMGATHSSSDAPASDAPLQAHQPSEFKVGQKRKAESAEQERDAKRQRLLLQEQKQEKREEKFAKKHKDIGTSQAHYEYLSQWAPAIRRFIDMRGKKRPPFIPQPICTYVDAEATAMSSQKLVSPTELKKNALTFLPPVHLFMNAGQKQDEKQQGKGKGKQGEELQGNSKERKPVDDRLDRYMVSFVRLLPMLLHLVRVSHRPGSKIKRFGTRDWRGILFIEWEEKGFWVRGPRGEAGEVGQGNGKKNRPLPLPIAETIFGVSEAERLLAHPEERPRFGKLPCGHEPTLELMKGDNELYAGLMHSLAQLLLLQTLPELVSNTKLKESTIPEAVDAKGTTHHTLDVTDASFKTREVPQLVYRKPPIARRIKNIVMGGNPIGSNGWPTPWSPEDLDSEPKQRRIWLREMCEFFVDAMFATDLDTMMAGTEGWYTQYQLRELAPGNLREAAMEKLEHHLFLRYVLTSIKRGQAPVEFQQSPNGNGHRCRECRLNEPAVSYDDLEDEGPDEFGAWDW